MFSNYVAAAVHNLLRNRLYTMISVGGLAVAFAATLLIAIFVRDEFSYDRWVAGAKDVYQVSTTFSDGPVHQGLDTAPPDVAAWLRVDYPEVKAVARLALDRLSIRQGQIEAVEPLVWADPDFFAVFPLPAVIGDLKTALTQPDSIVLTQTVARKYFGDASPIGQTLLIDKRHPMRVTAVIKDLPSNTHLDMTIIASGKASFSGLTLFDTMSGAGRSKPWIAYTYLRLPPGSSPKPITDHLPAFIRAHMPDWAMKDGKGLALSLIPIIDIHFSPQRVNQMTPRGDLAAAHSVAIVGLLIVLIAAINFVNLMTARAGRRAVEVGVRKLSGADRSDLIFQFIGEALIYAALAGLIAMSLAELLLPSLNAFLGRRMVFPFGVAIPTMLGLVFLIGALAGAYPALLMSSFRPAAVLKGGVARSSGSTALRQGLVAFQFAVLIGLVASTTVIWRQTVFATKESLRLNTDQMLVIRAPCPFKAVISGVDGVRGAACSLMAPLNNVYEVGAQTAQGRKLQLYSNAIGFGFFELYGMKPLAGRFFTQAFGEDSITAADDRSDRPEAVVINQTAARALGFARPADSVGKSFTWSHIKTTDGVFFKPHPARVVGVVEDFPITSIRALIEPTVFYVQSDFEQLINVKLTGRDIPETMKTLDALWRKSGHPDKIDAFFLDHVVQERYRDLTQQGQLFGIFAAIAVFIACLGLVGLAAFATERRTKEVGVRKAVGASSFDVLKLFLWQFTLPVLGANLIAWPVTYLAMSHWLEGFAYHTDLTAWPFAIAAVAAVLIAWLTVLAQAGRAARERPVAALRHE